MNHGQVHRVAAAHASPLVLSGLEAALADVDELRHVGSWSPPTSIDELVTTCRPDVVLMEYEHVVRTPGWRAALRRHERVRVVFLGRVDEPQEVLRSLHLGAVGFLHHSVPVPDLVRGLLDVVRGRTCIFLDAGPPPPVEATPPSAACDLTRREQEVLGMLLLRQSNDEIAEHLTITRQTAKNYVSQVFRKLGVSSRRELLHLDPPRAASATVSAASSVVGAAPLRARVRHG
ncbi:DNA-binding NarL/FixJ family response regulator [Nocardioides zeae]|uniref:DNA-binding NarL/FixJ family response regulator n=2 Tax=Nocardioides zeae TaxID=1457234 RepID=A0ACC6IIA6_9ACTN|nr:response regulator transcription factor [Nocardioides zeae]MDQ1104113.1 DNA-binding NarL/FixJ family response regulator [Nocardioides zeae]MDR6176196.1 DNA-binding NarL/FixJ family response regulator [Nocardioides zeae]MDR6210342.1 DNA-binding NarL/FixJ family response regulator [Nocardioides zeae]